MWLLLTEPQSLSVFAVESQTCWVDKAGLKPFTLLLYQDSWDYKYTQPAGGQMAL